jgi:hypothetical protein
MRGSAIMTRAFEWSAVAPRRRRGSTEPGRITYHEKSQFASKRAPRYVFTGCITTAAALLHRLIEAVPAWSSRNRINRPVDQHRLPQNMLLADRS